ncbi:Zinc finger protein 726 [Portunus trituberculatus]|uniref:Zinc finger protein 726 n=1 Tax=Portunus trituberculatus TaxID=210409 RepID=A0A5B7E5T1_PORTR|nr:Zinc finger protein 726 [Portunus trituberculatus]
MFRCEECGKQFAYKNNITHMIVHGGEEKFACEECCSLLSQQAQLSTHMLVHTDQGVTAVTGMPILQDKNFTCLTASIPSVAEKRFACEVCAKLFPRKSSLKTHRLVHSGEKRFECDECGSRFTRKSSLTTHRFTHTGEKKFECEECGSLFTRKSSLNIHRLAHRGEKKFECDKCGKSS